MFGIRKARHYKASHEENRIQAVLPFQTLNHGLPPSARIVVASFCNFPRFAHKRLKKNVLLDLKTSNVLW